MATGNPAFSKEVFAGYEQVYGASRSQVMTVQGTIGKTFALLAILSATTIWSWNAMASHRLELVVLPAAGIGGLVLALVTIFKPSVAMWTAPLYAAFEGVFLGAVSYIVETRVGKPGIALEAVSMTCGTLFCMLFAYRSGMIRVTDRLRTGIIAATGALCLVYAISLVMRMFGAQIPFLNDSSGLSIGISVVVVGLAAFNLLLDFDSIDRGARAQAPKFMEWYGAFGLILTLVWLYLEILRLLSKLQDRR